MQTYQLNFSGISVAKLFLDGNCDHYGDYTIVHLYYRNKKDIQNYETVGKVVNNLYMYDDFDDAQQTVYSGNPAVANNTDYYNDLQVTTAYHVFRCPLKLNNYPDYVYITIKEHRICNISITGKPKFLTLSTINLTDVSEFNCELNEGVTDSQEVLQNIINTYCDYVRIKPIGPLDNGYCYPKYATPLEPSHTIQL